MNLLSLMQSAYGGLVEFANYLQSPLLLILRLYWGWSFFLTGKGKLLDLENKTIFFTDLGIPFPKFNVILASSTECICGLLLLIGLGSRLVSLPLIFTMIVAYVTADNEALKAIFSDPDQFIDAAPFLFLLVCVIVLAFGPGKFSVDWLLARKFKPARSSA